MNFNMLAVKGNNKRGASAAFYTQLISDTVAQELLNFSSDVTVQNVKVQNSNFSTSTLARNTTHPVLVTNTYGLGISVTPDSYSTTTLGIQCKQNDAYSISSWAYTNDASEATFDVLSDGRVECTKVFFYKAK